MIKRFTKGGMERMSQSKLVYSTEFGRINEQKPQESAPKTDGIVRIKRITKGKKGKGVSSIEGLAMNKDELKTLCSALKKQCGCGGAVKDYNIEIQGDVREKLKEILESKGMKVKLAGG
jgi:translation initiation factor 1